jgi:hypothetical protein
LRFLLDLLVDGIAHPGIHATELRSRTREVGEVEKERGNGLDIADRMSTSSQD